MIRAALAALMLGLIRLYRQILSPCLPPRCRFLPTCSEYAAQAISQHGPWCGAKLALGRLLRCHPWRGSGLDEVPSRLDSRPCACSPLIERQRRFR